MHDYWTISIANTTYTKSQHYKKMVVNKHEIQTFEVAIVMLLLLLLSFDVFVPTNTHFLIFFIWTSGLSKYTSMSIIFFLSSFKESTIVVNV